ncbi:hypothetical protein PCASD_23938 [Puccinia coronata f. sp. avenae]|uniref:Uncharacterized protein n=1 Tax=Puccinia coronata f. sp. avenae TaxID=200324 RepID=A0A2N5S9V6_9BASI|nr:hypothetical protein PCASD_23938 [Puccinia coronata f. sp. avenae]
MNFNFQSNAQPPHPMAATNLNRSVYPQPPPPAPLGSYSQHYQNPNSAPYRLLLSALSKPEFPSNAYRHNPHGQHVDQQANRQETQEDGSSAPATPNVASNNHDTNHTSGPRTSGPNVREINCLLKSLAKDRKPPTPLPSEELSPVPVPAGTPCNENERLSQLPDDVMEEISGADLDELRDFEALHATSRRLPAYLKAETNQMQGATNYNNLCQFDPEAQEIFSAKDQELRQRCKEVAKVWNAMDPEIKAKYKDPNFLETIRGNVPITVVNGIVQTARKTHVASTTLNLASNKKSFSFVRKWAKDTIDKLNKIAACHSIKGFLVISSAWSSGDLYIQGGSRME